MNGTEFGSQHRRTQIAFRDRDTLPRAKHDCAKGLYVFAKRDLVLRAAVDVCKDDCRQTTPREAPEIVVIEDARERDGTSQARFGSHGYVYPGLLGEW